MRQLLAVEPLDGYKHVRDASRRAGRCEECCGDDLIGRNERERQSGRVLALEGRAGTNLRYVSRANRSAGRGACAGCTERQVGVLGGGDAIAQLRTASGGGAGERGRRGDEDFSDLAELAGRTLEKPRRVAAAEGDGRERISRPAYWFVIHEAIASFFLRGRERAGTKPGSVIADGSPYAAESHITTRALSASV